MSQDIFRTSGAGFKTGAKCTDTNLYKCTDNKVEYIEYISAGDIFPNFPGGNGKGYANWFTITLANDGDRRTFVAVKADKEIDDPPTTRVFNKLFLLAPLEREQEGSFASRGKK